MSSKLLSGVCLAAAAATLVAPAASAQGPDAAVLPRGMMELRVLGIYTQFNERFGANGAEPLGSAFSALIADPASRLASVQADSTRARLEGFYARTQERTGGETPLDVQPGTPAALLAGDFRRVPATLALGLTSRLTVELTGSIERRGTVVRGLIFEGSTLGINPDAERNRGILLRADSAYAAGVGRYLPTRGSAAGRELQRRVLELTDDTLTLPTEPIPVAALLADEGVALDSAEAALLGVRSARTGYELGDTYLGARLQLARTGDPWATPWDSVSNRGFRAVVGGRVRFPTGARSATLFPLEFPPEGGHWGVGGDAAVDWFVSRRWWVSAGGDLEVLFPADGKRLAFTDANPFPDTTLVRDVRLEPGARWSASITPRYRLTREIAFAAQYAFRSVGALTITGEDADARLGPIETTDARTAHSVAVGLGYSTVTAYRAGDSPFPAEASLLYRAVVSGTGYVPRAGSVELTARIFAPVLWRPRRAQRDSAVARPPSRPLDAEPTIPAPDSARTVRPVEPPPPPPPPPPASPGAGVILAALPGRS